MSESIEPLRIVPRVPAQFKNLSKTNAGATPCDNLRRSLARSRCSRTEILVDAEAARQRRTDLSEQR